jgi:alkanesulfonate monooxygenase SsuD/methylene tetrahydromethanopterin reductase-like flavin-dependent oxidoreductase (luciferase family)
VQVRVALRTPAASLRLAAAVRAARAAERSADLLWIDAEDEAEGLLAAAALATRSARIGIAVGVGLPLHQPIRVAEDVATLDGLSAGRCELVLRPGATAPDRWEELEEEVALLRRAWSAEPLERSGAGGVRQSLDVHPKPARPGGPHLWIEPDRAAAEAGARSAARLGAGLVADDGRQARRYLDLWRRAGRGDPPRVALRLQPGEISDLPKGVGGEGGRELSRFLAAARARVEEVAAGLWPVGRDRPAVVTGIFAPGAPGDRILEAGGDA